MPLMVIHPPEATALGTLTGLVAGPGAPVHVPEKPVGPADPEQTSPFASVHVPAQPVAGL